MINDFSIPISALLRFAALLDNETEPINLNNTEHFPVSPTKQQKTLSSQKLRNQNASLQKINERQKNRPVSINPVNKNNKVHVYADSHGKGLGDIIGSLLPRTIETFVYASSGATTTHILDETSKVIRNFNKDDTMVIIAGANDICGTSDRNPNTPKTILELFKSFALENKHTNIVFLTQLHRHDRAWDSKVNKEIYRLNYELKQLSSLDIINISDFKRNFLRLMAST